MTRINQAFIFAAGRGERMRPLTDSIPKPLVKIKGKSIIDYTIEKLDQISAIEKIIINGFYLANQLKSHIEALHNPKIIFSQEVEKIETGGGIIYAKDKIDFTKPLLTINGDILWQDDNTSDIELLCNAWEKSQQSASPCDIMLGLKRKEDYFGYDGNQHGGGDFNFDVKNNKLSRISNHAMSHVFVGMQIFKPEILQQFSEKCFSLSLLYKENPDTHQLLQNIAAIELQGRYFHIGTVDAIGETEAKLNS